MYEKYVLLTFKAFPLHNISSSLSSSQTTQNEIGQCLLFNHYFVHIERLPPLILLPVWFDVMWLFANCNNPLFVLALQRSLILLYRANVNSMFKKKNIKLSKRLKLNIKMLMLIVISKCVEAEWPNIQLTALSSGEKSSCLCTVTPLARLIIVLHTRHSCPVPLFFLSFCVEQPLYAGNKNPRWVTLYYCICDYWQLKQL